MRNEIIPVLPLVAISILSFKALLSQLQQIDFTNWRLYAAALGFTIVASLTGYFFVKLKRKRPDIRTN